MPMERLPALDHDGKAYTVVRKIPYFPANSRTSAHMNMATFQLDTGEILAPTGAPGTFRTLDGSIVLTLVAG
jgi:hypothetical protein